MINTAELANTYIMPHNHRFFSFLFGESIYDLLT